MRSRMPPSPSSVHPPSTDTCLSLLLFSFRLYPRFSLLPLPYSFLSLLHPFVCEREPVALASLCLIALFSLELYFIALPRTSFAHFCLQYFAFHCPRIRFPWQCAALHCHCIDCISFTALHFFALNCMEESLSFMRLCSVHVVDISSPYFQRPCG